MELEVPLKDKGKQDSLNEHINMQNNVLSGDARQEYRIFSTSLATETSLRWYLYLPGGVATERDRA